MAATLALKCHCGDTYTARVADLERGWAMSCSKSCAAIKRDFGRPKPKRVDGLPLPKKLKKGAKLITPDNRVYPQADFEFIDEDDSFYWQGKD